MRSSKWLVPAALAVLAVSVSWPQEAYAQRGRAAGNWHCSCPGGPREVPNSINSGAPDCRSVCFPGSGGGGGPGLTSLQQMQLNLAGQAGTLLGSMLRDALFGNPQSGQGAGERAAREAAERAAEETRRAEIQRALEAERRRLEETRDRLLASLRTLGGTPELAIRGVDSGPELQFRLDETLAPRFAELPPNSAMAQLTGAVFLSGQAAAAPNDEEAAVLARAAFDSAMGAGVDLPVPPSTRAVALDDAAVARIEAARAGYRQAMEQVNTELAKLAEAEQQLAVAHRVLDRARADLASERDAFMRNPSPQLKPRIVRAERIEQEALKLVNGQDAYAAARRAAVEKIAPKLADPPNNPLNEPTVWQTQQAIGAYLRGLLDGALCLPSSADLYCAGTGPLQAKCGQSYAGGFRRGERAKEARLREAHTIGVAARAGGDSFVGFDHPRSGGTCRVKWLQSFYSGFKGFPFNMAGR
jgi:hypothetical protein